jgi:hypothetical protein
VAVLLAICAISLLVFVSGSSSDTAESTSTANAPATIGEKDATTGIASVTFAEKAAARVGIQTANVTEGEGGVAVPYSAILYDSKGHSFVYTVTGPLSYLRAEITVDRVQGDQAFLSSGPAAGTEIVTQGAAELYGAETGIK